MAVRIRYGDLGKYSFKVLLGLVMKRTINKKPNYNFYELVGETETELVHCNAIDRLVTRGYINKDFVITLEGEKVVAEILKKVDGSSYL